MTLDLRTFTHRCHGEANGGLSPNSFLCVPPHRDLLPAGSHHPHTHHPGSHHPHTYHGGARSLHLPAPQTQLARRLLEAVAPAWLRCLHPLDVLVLAETCDVPLLQQAALAVVDALWDREDQELTDRLQVR